MATRTNFLNLILPANNEFTDSWDQPVNNNMVALDEFLETLESEIRAARFARPSLAEFLNVSHFSDGTLRPSEESLDARNSPIYGVEAGGQEFQLKQRLDRADREVFTARENQDNLLANLARRSRDNDYPDSVLSGPQSGGNPNFLAHSGNEFQLNGDPTPILFNVDGYMLVLRDDLNIPVSGGDGTRYLVAKRPTESVTVIDRSTQEAAITTTNNITSQVQVMRDPGVNFQNIINGKRVREGMVLRILNTVNAGDYVIDEVGFGGEGTDLKVIGRFETAIASINYIIIDPLRPEFEVVTSPQRQSGKCFIGEGVFAGGALTSSITYAFKRKYESDYRAVNVSSSPTFEEIFNHNIGEHPRKITIYASQTNDGNSPWEPLSTALVGQDLEVNVSNTLSFTPGQFDPGTGDSEYTQASLAGDVDADIIGGVFALRSVQVRITRNQVVIKNARDNHFYRDFEGTDRAQGFLKVVCER